MSEQIIWNFLKSKGLTDEGCAGLMGNLYAESGLSPTNMENVYEKKLGYNDSTYTAAVDNGSYINFVNDAVGYGLAQWTYYTRKQGLYNLAKSKNKSIGDINIQLEYLYQELQSSFPKILNLLKTSHNLIETTSTVLLDFERPANRGNSVITQRTQYATTYYNKYHGSTNTTTQGGSKMPVASDVLKVAQGEIGYHEKSSNSSLDNKTSNSGSRNWTKYARDLAAAGYYNGNKNGYAWCDVFVDWCFYQACGKNKKTAEYLECQTGDCGAGCDFSASYYKSAGRFSTTPQVGDQIFFRSGNSITHTGLVESVTSSTVNTIEGNTSDQVARRSYSRSSSSIYGYGHPRYDGTSTGVTPTPTPSGSGSTSSGSGSSDIKKFQTWLNSNYSAGLAVDGEYGPLTKKAAIKAYQKICNASYNSGLVVDGAFGPLSKKAIAKHPLKKGASNTKLVYVLQGMLICLGYDTGGFDGDYGTKTYSAVKSFQSRKGILVDGEAGQDTFAKLFS